MKYHLNNIFLLTFIFLSVDLSAQDKKLSVTCFNKAQQLFVSGKNKEAIEGFSKAIAADSLNYDAWIKRGFVKGIVGDFQGEMEDYTHVIKIDEKHVWAYISRGSAKNRTGEYNSAIDDFNKAIELDAKQPEAYNNRGFSFKAMGNMDQACQDWNRSKQLGNDEAKIILKNNHCK